VGCSFAIHSRPDRIATARPDEHLQNLPGHVDDYPDALRIIAERLKTKGAVTLHDIEVGLKQEREKKA